MLCYSNCCRWSGGVRGWAYACVCVRMKTLEEKISAHNVEAPNMVLDLKTEVDALHSKLEVRHTDR